MDDDVDWGCDDAEIHEYFEDFSSIPLTKNDDNDESMDDGFVLPGTELCSSHLVTSGPGTYRCGDAVIASIAGYKHEADGVITVSPSTEKTVKQREGPGLGSVVLARVVRVTPRYVNCDIFAVNGVVQKSCCRGQIRPTDVLPVMLDRIALLDCFRPKDIIRAQVIATGVSRTFLLSTMAPEFGVIRAYDEDTGEMLEPFASGLMRTIKSKKLVWRKCAQPTFVS